MTQDTNEAPDGVTIEIGWKAGLAALGVVALLVGAFFVWPRLQAGGMLPGGPPQGGQGELLATVGERRITEHDVDVMFTIQKVLAEATGKQLDASESVVRAVRRDMLDQLVDSALLSDAARAAGHSVSPNVVETEITPILAAQNVQLASVKPTLVAAGVSEADFLAWAGEQLLINRYVQSPEGLAKGRETLLKRGMPEAMLGQAPVASADVASALQEVADIRFFLMDEAAGSPPVREGQPAPDFTVKGPDGQPVSLASLRGKPVMLNFWATWCGPCKVEMPIYASTYEQHKAQGLEVLAVDVQESVEQVQSFLATNQLPFRIGLDGDGSVATIYRVRGLPTTVFVGADGVVTKVHRGAIRTAEELAPFLQTILPGAQASATSAPATK